MFFSKLPLIAAVACLTAQTIAAPLPSNQDSGLVVVRAPATDERTGADYIYTKKRAADEKRDVAYIYTQKKRAADDKRDVAYIYTQ
jgi:hypothetical protein